MMECKSCGDTFERGPKRGSDRLVLCDPCFDGFVARLKNVSEGVERLRRRDDDCTDECLDCHIVLDIDDIMEGRNRCKSCDQMKQRIAYLLSSQSEEEADRRLQEFLRGDKE